MDSTKLNRNKYYEITKYLIFMLRNHNFVLSMALPSSISLINLLYWKTGLRVVIR